MQRGHGDEHRVLDVLTEEECWDLLRGARLGRLVYTDGALPAVVPVSYAVVGEDLVLAVTSDTKVAAASRGEIVALQIDDADGPSRTGWSVTAVGPSRRLADTHLAAALAADGLVPWSPTLLATHVAIHVRLLTGRRLSRTGVPV